jgi:GMP synthase (glutamine-hydrolysing)
MHILLVITGHTIEPARSLLGNTDAHFQTAAHGTKLVPFSICENETTPDLKKFDGVIMTGSAAMLADNSPWMQNAKDLIKECLDTGAPFLGVCFGHQMLGAVCGAEVGQNPKGRHNGTCVVRVETESQLFEGMPKSFDAQISHRDVILEKRPEFVVTASTDHDPHHSIQVGEKAFGVQFHPEWNIDISRAYIDAREQVLGLDVASRMRKTLCESPYAQRVVHNFIKICG